MVAVVKCSGYRKCVHGIVWRWDGGVRKKGQKTKTRILGGPEGIYISKTLSVAPHKIYIMGITRVKLTSDDILNIRLENRLGVFKWESVYVLPFAYIPLLHESLLVQMPDDNSDCISPLFDFSETTILVR